MGKLALNVGHKSMEQVWMFSLACPFIMIISYEP